jgi:hypothetical protein
VAGEVNKIAGLHKAMRRQLSAISVACFVLLTNVGAVLGANPLELFLHSPDLAERKAAYLDIVKNSAQYVDQIKQELETFAATKEIRIDVLKRYIYLAAIIRNDKFIEPLVAIFKNYEALGGECIYCCPIEFALSLFAAFADWSPPPEIMTKTTAQIPTDLRTLIWHIEDMKRRPEIREGYIVEFADTEKQKWFERLTALSVEELIKLTGPENADSDERFWAALPLSRKVTDDKYLTELYWLAIEELPPGGGIGSYLCDIYAAIERAEIAKAQKNLRK